MNGTMTLSGAGVYIFRVPTGLTANVGSTVLSPGVDPCNVFGQVGSAAATLNGVNFVGNVVAQAGVTLGVNAILTGRALATSGPVTLAGTNRVGGCSLAGPPLITSATMASGTGGTPFSYQITATNTPTSFVATGLPADLSINEATGLITGTPTTAGTSTVTLTATNASGTGGTTLTLTIAALVPTLSQWAMVGLVLLLALAGYMGIRKRNS